MMNKQAGPDPIGSKAVKSRTGVHHLITGYMGNISLQHVQHQVPGASGVQASLKRRPVLVC
jgi:hypothetical protein